MWPFTSIDADAALEECERRLYPNCMHQRNKTTEIVCSNCHHHFFVHGEPDSVSCPRCNEILEIEYDD